MKNIITSVCFSLLSFISFANITDTVPPVWTSQLPTDITVGCSQVPVASNMTASDDSGSVTIAFSEMVIPGSCPSNYTITRTWTATDPSGNTITHSQQITVQDITVPVLVDAYTPTLSVNCNAIPSVPSLTFVDDCGTVNVNYSENSSAITNGMYTIIRTWLASDACGNTANYSQVINVDCSATVGQINAVDDTFSVVYGATQVIAGDFLLNDTLGGSQAQASNVTITMISTSNAGISISGTNIVVAGGTPS